MKIVNRGQEQFEVKTWSDREVNLLIDLFASGLTVKDIAFKLERTIDSCYGKLYKLKIKDEKTRPPLDDAEFNHRVKLFLERKKCKAENKA